MLVLLYIGSHFCLENKVLLVELGLCNWHQLEVPTNQVWPSCQIYQAHTLSWPPSDNTAEAFAKALPLHTQDQISNWLRHQADETYPAGKEHVQVKPPIVPNLNEKSM